MDERALTALKASIKHWEENVEAEYPSDASADAEDCALCNEYAGYFECYRCPVAEKTGVDDCRQTPWQRAFNALCAWENDESLGEDFRAAAQAELDFLRSLLPEGEQA